MSLHTGNLQRCVAIVILNVGQFLVGAQQQDDVVTLTPLGRSMEQRLSIPGVGIVHETCGDTREYINNWYTLFILIRLYRIAP